MNTKTFNKENIVALRKKYEKNPVQQDFANDKSVFEFPDDITDEELDKHIERMKSQQ